MNTLHVKKGDTVQVISGRSKGGKGKIIATSPKEGKVIIEGVNMVSKHVKPKRQGETGGIIKTEGPVLACKVMLVCPKCGKPSRTGVRFEEDGKNKTLKKIRYCKKCNANI